MSVYITQKVLVPLNIWWSLKYGNFILYKWIAYPLRYQGYFQNIYLCMTWKSLYN